MSLASGYYTRRKITLLLLLILVLAGVIRIYSFYGYHGSDDARYARLAYYVANGSFKIGGSCVWPEFALYLHHCQRVGLFIPVALCFKIVGVSEFSMLIYPFVLSMLNIILAYLAGRAIFGTRAGIIAAAICAIIPIEGRFATLLSPNLVAAFWANLGVLLLYYGSKRKALISKITYGLLSGLALGLSWLCFEAGLYLLPFLAAYIFYACCRQRRNILLLISAGLMLTTILLSESLTYYKHTNDLFHRYHQIEKDCTVYSEAISKGSGNRRLIEEYYYNRRSNSDPTDWRVIAKRVFLGGPKNILINQDFGLISGVALLAIIYALFRRLRSFLFPGFWFLALALMFNFASLRLHCYMPIPFIESRYLLPLLFPATVLTAGLLDTLLPLRGVIKMEIARERFFWGSVMAISIVLICFYGTYKINRVGTQIIRDQRISERAISNILRPLDPIYTDLTTAETLSFFWKYPAETSIRNFAGMQTKDIPQVAYVLINRGRIETAIYWFGYSLPEFYNHIPNHWQLKWSGSRIELYRVPYQE